MKWQNVKWLFLWLSSYYAILSNLTKYFSLSWLRLFDFSNIWDLTCFKSICNQECPSAVVATGKIQSSFRHGYPLMLEKIFHISHSSTFEWKWKAPMMYAIKFAKSTSLSYERNFIFVNVLLNIHGQIHAGYGNAGVWYFGCL